MRWLWSYTGRKQINRMKNDLRDSVVVLSCNHYLIRYWSSVAKEQMLPTIFDENDIELQKMALDGF